MGEVAGQSGSERDAADAVAVVVAIAVPPPPPPPPPLPSAAAPPPPPAPAAAASVLVSSEQPPALSLVLLFGSEQRAKFDQYWTMAVESK